MLFPRRVEGNSRPQRPKTDKARPRPRRQKATLEIEAILADLSAMCTGYVQKLGRSEIKSAFSTFNELGLKADPKSLERLRFSFQGRPFAETTDRYIGYPSLVFRTEGDTIAACPMRWGFLARNLENWDAAKKEKSLHNARSEGIVSKWPWKHPIKERRTCLILVNWFRESGDAPEEQGRAKPQKRHYRFASGEPMMVAGLWNSTLVGGEPIESMTMITTAASRAVAPIHDRMPCILPKGSYGDWLKSKASIDDDLSAILKVSDVALTVTGMAGYALNSIDAAYSAIEGKISEQLQLL